MLDIVKVPERDIISDVLPSFILLALLLPLFEEAGILRRILNLDIFSTLALYIVLSVIAYPLVFPIREKGIRAFGFLDRRLNSEGGYSQIVERVRRQYDGTKLWLVM